MAGADQAGRQAAMATLAHAGSDKLRRLWAWEDKDRTGVEGESALAALGYAQPTNDDAGDAGGAWITAV